jgi:hypothetical protein
MTTSPTAGNASGPELAWVPVDACTLPTADRPLRVAEFDELFATSLRGIERPAHGGTRARLLLAGDETLPARVRRLVAAETSCCSFFSFTLAPVGTEADLEQGQATVALEIEVPAARTDVLDALLDRADTGRGADTS